MRRYVYLDSPGTPTVIFDGDKVESLVDGDGELYVKIDGKQAAIFARGKWTHVTDPDLAPPPPS